MVYVPVLATFCTTVEPGGAKSAQTYQSPEPIISISGYSPTCYSLNLHGISYQHNFVIIPYIGSVIPSTVNFKGKLDYRVVFSMTSYCLKIVSYFEHPPFLYFLMFISLNPPKVYSSVFRPSFPEPTPYLEYPLAPLKKPPRFLKVLFLFEPPFKETNFVGFPIWTLLPP